MELKFDSRTDMLEVFPTRLFMFAIEGCAPLNDALKAAALTREASGEANAGGVIGGWRSGDDLFDWPDKGIDAIRQTALGAIQAVVPQIAGRDCTFNVRLSGSATVLRYGAYEKSHLTPRHHLTMVYAVEAGDTPNADAPESGTIEIDDPRSAGRACRPADRPCWQPYAGGVEEWPAHGIPKLAYLPHEPLLRGWGAGHADARGGNPQHEAILIFRRRY